MEICNTSGKHLHANDNYMPINGFHYNTVPRLISTRNWCIKMFVVAVVFN